MSHLTEKQRYTIQVLLSQSYSKTEIASCLGKHKTVIYREIQRNCDKRSGVYTSDLAQRKYASRIKEKKKKIIFTDQIKQTVNDLIKKDYSPEQIVGYCKKTQIACVSIETIYKYVWADKKHKGSLFKHLRTQGKRYSGYANKKWSLS